MVRSGHRAVLVEGAVWAAVLVAALVPFLRLVRADFLCVGDLVLLEHAPWLADGIQRAEIPRTLVPDPLLGLRPLAWWSFGLDLASFRDSPRGPHLMNLVLHVLDVLLVMELLLRARARLVASRTRALLEAGGVAVLFALHPLQVEAVAWWSARGELLATTALLLGLGAHLRWTRRAERGPRVPIAVTVAMVVGLFASPWALAFPLLLVAFDRWPLERPMATGLRDFLRREWREKGVPILTMGVAALLCVLALPEKAPALSVRERTLGAAIDFLGDTSRLVWPTSLVLHHPEGDPASRFRALVALAGLAAFGVLAVAGRRKAPAWFAALIAYPAAWWVAALVRTPLLEPATEHRAHLARLFLFAAAVTSVSSLLPRSRTGRSVFAALVLAVLGGLARQTFEQTRWWRSSLFALEHVLRCHPRDPWAHEQLALVLLDRGEAQNAEEHLDRALAVDPDLRLALIAKARCRMDAGDPGAALASLEHAFELGAETADSRRLAAEIELRLGKPSFAVAQLERAVALEPEHGLSRRRLGELLQDLGRADEALVQLDAAVELLPEADDVRERCVDLLLTLERFSEALERTEDPSRATHNEPVLFTQRAIAELGLGRAGEARDWLERAVQRAPTYARAHRELGRLLRQAGLFDEALAELDRAVQLDPGEAEGHLELGLLQWERGNEAELRGRIEILTRLDPRRAAELERIARGR